MEEMENIRTSDKLEEMFESIHGKKSDPKWEEKNCSANDSALGGGMQFRWPINKPDEIIFFPIIHPEKKKSLLLMSSKTSNTLQLKNRPENEGEKAKERAGADTKQPSLMSLHCSPPLLLACFPSPFFCQSNLVVSSGQTSAPASPLTLKLLRVALKTLIHL